MYRRQKESWLKHWDFSLLDMILLIASYLVTYFIRFHDFSPANTGIYRSVALVIVLFAICFLFFRENYHNVLKRGYWKEFLEVVKMVSFVTIGMVLYLFLLKISAVYSRMFVLMYPFFAIVFLYSGRMILKLWLRGRLASLKGRRVLFLVASFTNYKEIADTFLKNPYSEFELTGIGLYDQTQTIQKEYNGIPLYYGKKDSIAAIWSNCTDEVLFDAPYLMNLPEDMIEQCEVMGLTVHVRLAQVRNSMQDRIVEDMEGHTVISTSMKISSNRQMIVKRMMDIVGGLIGIVFTGILTIVIGPIIYLKSPGSIFFSQIRIGKNGRRFKIYKFRSMYLDAEKRKKELMAYNKMDGLMFKIEDDPRIIKGIGNFIRRTSLDEFPQFWNVLKGEMSLVGTRPPTVDEWEQYEMHHRARLAAKPGITGLWQVSGRNDITDFEEIVRLDTKYISEWSIGMDIKILLQTVDVVLRRKGSA